MKISSLINSRRYELSCEISYNPFPINPILLSLDHESLLYLCNCPFTLATGLKLSLIPSIPISKSTKHQAIEKFHSKYTILK